MIHKAEFRARNIPVLDRQRTDKGLVHARIKEESHDCYSRYNDNAKYNEGESGIALEVRIVKSGLILIKIDLCRDLFGCKVFSSAVFCLRQSGNDRCCGKFL